MNKKLLLEKYIKVAIRKALKEQEVAEKKAEKAMYLVYRFPGLKKIIEELMSPSFGRYISGIDIVAPKPTTFQINLINGQDFSIYYVGSGNFTAKIAGKRYDPNNIGESERASQAIADLLELNYAPREMEEAKAGGANAAKDAELAADLSAAPEAPAPEIPTPEETLPPAEA